MMGPGKNLAPARGFNLPCNPAVPDFLIRLQSEGKEVSTLILETKGYDPLEEVKSAAAQRWVHSVNADWQYGQWAYRIVHKVTDIDQIVKEEAKRVQPSA